MGKTWPLQDAKNRLSEVVDKALTEGPQVISRRGKEAVVVLAADEYARLTRPPTSLLEFFENSPLYGAGLELERERDTGREVDFELPA